MNQGSYNFAEIEAHWRQYWLTNKSYKTAGPGEEGFDPQCPKCYILDMFPYPSGAGLHIGHPKGYIATDIYSRFKRLNGYNVLHPMGFDSFGLPAEQYAIEHNVHPSIVTEENIVNIRKQLQFLGLAYDWDREIATSREDFYQWTQWIFLQLYNSYYDGSFEWTDQTGRKVIGKARKIDVLVDEFEKGRAFSAADLDYLDSASETCWRDLSKSQQQGLLNHYRLVYQKEVTVNWCPGLGTVLANEEVTNEGKSERGDFPVYKRPLKQWMMRITAYGERLLDDLDAESLPDGDNNSFALDWPEPIKLMQRNWIGKSTGAEVDFAVLNPATGQPSSKLKVFTTRPDTLFGATFMAIAPQHPLVDNNSPEYLVPKEWPEDTPQAWKGNPGASDIQAAIADYIAAAAQNVAAEEDEREKTGVFSGLFARNPVNGSSIPIFVADYVSMEYGTGAIMAVPAHDERDWEYAQKYGLKIQAVVAAPDALDGCFSGEGKAINSPGQGDSPYAIDGLETKAAKSQITTVLQQRGVGKGATTYKLRDWIFSRQRYWGEPFPLAHRDDGFSAPVDIPVLLPEMEDFRPDTSDDPDRPVSPPLSRAPQEWLELESNGQTFRRELNVMPQWAGSCWYFLRFIDPGNKTAFVDADKERFFMPVDLYVGGAEHAVLHLLYARFWHKALYDLDHVSTPEPFKKLFNQGMITADAFTDSRGVYIDIRQVEIRDGQPFERTSGEALTRVAGKMGKRFKNGLPPEEVGQEYGVDTLRLYEMYMGPLEASTPWSMDGIRGMQRFLQRVWRNLIDPQRLGKLGGEADKEMEKSLNKTIKKVGEDIDGLRFNTAIAALIEFNNSLVQYDKIPKKVAQDFLVMLAPFVPHLAEEIWSVCGFGQGDIQQQTWPEYDEALIAEEMVLLPIQINGKKRGNIEVPVDIADEKLQELVLGLESLDPYIGNKDQIKRFIVVPRRIVNIVV